MNYAAEWWAGIASSAVAELKVLNRENRQQYQGSFQSDAQESRFWHVTNLIIESLTDQMNDVVWDSIIR